MSLRQPTRVYHGQSLAEAQDLAGFLGEHGVEVRLVEGDPLGHTHPASHVFHDVMVVDVEHEQLQSLISTWQSQRAANPAINNTSFCYHCGQELDEPVTACPACQGSLLD